MKEQRQNTFNDLMALKWKWNGSGTRQASMLKYAHTTEMDRQTQTGNYGILFVNLYVFVSLVKMSTKDDNNDADDCDNDEQEVIEKLVCMYVRQ